MSRGDDAVHPYEVVAHYYGGGMEERRVPGITLREHFAGLAMQAMIGTAAAPCLTGFGGAEAAIAEGACRMADALVAEFAKETK